MDAVCLPALTSGFPTRPPGGGHCAAKAYLCRAKTQNGTVPPRELLLAGQQRAKDGALLLAFPRRKTPMPIETNSGKACGFDGPKDLAKTFPSVSCCFHLPSPNLRHSHGRLWHTSHTPRRGEGQSFFWLVCVPIALCKMPD